MIRPHDLRLPTSDFRPRATLVAVLALLATVSAAAEPTADEARQTLVKSGLRVQEATWIHADEAELTADFARLPALEKECHVAKQKVDEVVAANDRTATRLAEAKERVERTLKRLKDPTLTGSDRRAVEDRLREERQRVVDLDKQFKDENELGEWEPARSAVEKLIAARNRLDLTALAIRRRAGDPALKSRYADLKKTPVVAAALKAARPGKLGPLRDYAAEIKRLDTADKITHAADVPTYRVESHFRFPVIVNERAAAEFSLRHSTGPTVIPHSLAEAAGVTIDKSAPAVEYIVSPTRRLTAHWASVPTLRLGGQTIQSARVVVLPPEAEDLAAKLGRDALTGLKTEVRGRELRMVVGKQE